jgi:inosine-uridine nucleoside N-ribohydrolase
MVQLERQTIETHYKPRSENGGKGTYEFCDQLAVAAAITPEVVRENKQVYATVELKGALTTGQMVVDWSGVLGKPANINLVTKIDIMAVADMYTAAMTSY